VVCLLIFVLVKNSCQRYRDCSYFLWHHVCLCQFLAYPQFFLVKILNEPFFLSSSFSAGAMLTFHVLFVLNPNTVYRKIHPVPVQLVCSLCTVSHA
jgi:hypothetical protein